MPTEIVIPLVRGVTNTASVPVAISGDGQWTLEILDAGYATDSGHMVGDFDDLTAAMQASVSGGSQVSLDQPQAVVLVNGTGSQTVQVQLHQLVQPADRPGDYRITLTFIIVPGF